MRIIPFLISSVSTIILIICLNIQWSIGDKKTPVFGSFLSPQHGFWQNAEPVGESFNTSVKLPGLKGKGEVYFDGYLIPHVTAASEADACYIQGYLHAKFRLWQMEFQTFAAGGRLSEVLGEGKNGAYLRYDRSMRRLGMVTAAQSSLALMEKDPAVKSDLDAYTAGVNAYIGQLTAGDLPLEYKILNYQPEPWTNLKTALFVKYMAYDLAGHDNDFEMTNAKAVFSKEDFAKLYPATQDSLDPIIPKGTHFLMPANLPKAPATADSLYFNNTTTVTTGEMKPDKDNGSNNWAVSGKKTLSGRPILCNDPHLSTNLPSIWYQMQIRTPTYNAYGVSFPGAPFIIIGFNDFCSWGITNSERDVRDYYDIKFKDDSRKEYWFNNHWQEADIRVDTFNVRYGQPFYDTVATTVFGPVMFEPAFSGLTDAGTTHSYAVRWKPNDPSDELWTFSRFQAMKNYDDYKAALGGFSTPGQNFVFACKDGVIAIRQDGVYPAKWKGQGLFVMPGEDSSYMWQDSIPREYNPYMITDATDSDSRGFVSSANQLPVDTTYPYYLGTDFPMYRGLEINRQLQHLNSITPADMMRLQTDNTDVFAQMAKPLFLRNIDDKKLSTEEMKVLDIFRNWNCKNDPQEEGPTIFRYWWAHLDQDIYDDEFENKPQPIMRPFESTLLEALLRDTAYSFIDNIKTPEKETLPQIMTAAFQKTVADVAEAGRNDKLSWAKNKGTMVRHLLRDASLSRTNLPIGGGLHCINAARQLHGPSWRMIVQMTDKTEAYGIYPGGQSGNPGSPYYDTFIDKWAAGLYNPLWVMAADEAADKRIKWVMHFSGN